VKIFLIVVSLIFVSCTHNQHFPELLTTKVPLENLKIDAPLLNDVVNTDSIREYSGSADLENLWTYKNHFYEKKANFSLEDFVEEWEKIRTTTTTSTQHWSKEEIIKWFEVNALLFQLTGNEKFVEQMEKTALSFSKTTGDTYKKIVAPYIYTKNVDHIHVNLFVPAEVSYEHTLKGSVKISQKTDFPNSGSVKLNFNMTQQRYIELFVRIPAWAAGATVTVKKVKYMATPGTYCKIAKKWREGDLVEIEFPQEKIPSYLKK